MTVALSARRCVTMARSSVDVLQVLGSVLVGGSGGVRRMRLTIEVSSPLISLPISFSFLFQTVGWVGFRPLWTVPVKVSGYNLV